MASKLSDPLMLFCPKALGFPKAGLFQMKGQPWITPFEFRGQHIGRRR